MKSSELQLCVECQDVHDLGTRECPICNCSQAILLDRIVNRRPIEALSSRCVEGALRYARGSVRAIIPRAWSDA